LIVVATGGDSAESPTNTDGAGRSSATGGERCSDRVARVYRPDETALDAEKKKKKKKKNRAEP